MSDKALYRFVRDVSAVLIPSKGRLSRPSFEAWQLIWLRDLHRRKDCAINMCRTGRWHSGIGFWYLFRLYYPHCCPRFPPTRPESQNPSSSPLQQPCRSPESLIIDTCSESAGWPVEPFLTYILFKHGTRWDLLRVKRWHYTCSGASWKREAGGSWLWGFHSRTSAEYDLSSQKMSHNSEQDLCESLEPSGCRRLHEKKKKGKKKTSVIELDRTRTRFVLARTFQTLLKACETLRLSAPATDAVLCAQCSVSHLSANYWPFARLYTPQKTGHRIFKLFLKPAQPFPLLHTGHAHSTFLANQTMLLRSQDKKNKFPCFCGVCKIATHRDAHIKCDFRTNANTEDKNVSWLSWRARCPLGAIKRVISSLHLCCLATFVKIKTL